ncbi:MAG: hypothetical protein AABZ12_09045 [Planctomycetota bacterium]
MTSVRNANGWSHAVRSVLALAAGGICLGSSCSQQEISAILTGVQVVADQLSQEDDDIKFSDWLSSELED